MFLMRDKNDDHIHASEDRMDEKVEDAFWKMRVQACVLWFCGFVWGGGEARKGIKKILTIRDKNGLGSE